MRDIDRPDRKDRLIKKQQRQHARAMKLAGGGAPGEMEQVVAADDNVEGSKGVGEYQTV
jgi:hypothetical protein